jgi:hypothetical protein
MAPTHTANLTRDTTTDQKTLPRAHQSAPRAPHPDRRRLSAKTRQPREHDDDLEGPWHGLRFDVSLSPG